MDEKYCTRCGGLIRLLFNLRRCPEGCRPARHALTFPGFWSVYAGRPRFVDRDHGGPEDHVRLGACVLMFDALGADSASHVTVVKNMTWDATVGKTYVLSEREREAISGRAELAPEDLRKRYGLDFMAVLVRED